MREGMALAPCGHEVHAGVLVTYGCPRCLKEALDALRRERAVLALRGSVTAAATIAV